jgi:hypothetical protein
MSKIKKVENKDVPNFLKKMLLKLTITKFKKKCNSIDIKLIAKKEYNILLSLILSLLKKVKIVINIVI